MHYLKGLAQFFQAVFFRKSSISYSANPVAKEAITKTTTVRKKQQSLASFLKISERTDATSNFRGSENAEVMGKEGGIITSDDSNQPILKVRNVYRDFENWNKAHEGEGRTITVEFDGFFLIVCYVPNSGGKTVSSRLFLLF